MARIMGIDYGVKRIGIAVSDPLGFTAQPVEVIERQASLNADIRHITAMAQAREVASIVVGLPLNMDGSPGHLTDEVTGFCDKLRSAAGLPVELYDERMTTIQAERMLTEEADMSREKRRKVRDKLAASLLLQSYLDHRK